jgi:hypothetical protein
VPLTISAVDLDSGVVTLTDGSHWQVGPGDAGSIAGWAAGRPAALTATGLTRQIVYQDDGSAPLVCPAAGRG